MLTPWVMRLLIANVAVFAMQQVFTWFTQLFMFIPQLVLVRPWGLFTHMFLHGDVQHIFWNMLGLFIFGPRVEERMGGRRFIQMYLVAGLVGGLFHLIMSPAPVVGASGALYGVMMAYALFWPRSEVLIFGIVPVQAWLLVVIYTFWNLFQGVGGFGNVANFAHLGGYVGAYGYLWALEKYSPANRFRARVNSVAPATEKALKQNLDKVNLEGVHQLSRDEVNRILDKISAQGIKSLTVEEKRFLSNFVPPDDRKDWVQ